MHLYSVGAVIYSSANMPYLKPLFVNVTEPGEYTYNPHNCAGFSRVMINASSGGAAHIVKRVPDRAQYGAVFTYTDNGTFYPRPSTEFLSLADPTVIVDTSKHLVTLEMAAKIELWDRGGDPREDYLIDFALDDLPHLPEIYGWNRIKIWATWDPRVQEDWEDETVYITTNEADIKLKDHMGHWVPGINLHASCRFALSRVNGHRPIEFEFHRIATEMAIAEGRMAVAIKKDFNFVGDQCVIFTGYYAPKDGGPRIVYPGINCYVLVLRTELLPSEFALKIGGDDDKSMIEAVPEEGTNQRDIKVTVDLEFFDCSAWSLLFAEGEES